MKKNILLFLVFLFCFLPLARALDAIEVTTGFLNGNLSHTNKKYQGVPLLVAFDFDGKPLLGKIGLKFPGRFDFVLEPFINTINSPSSNVEAGSNFLIKYVFPLNAKIQPYVKGGLGMLYMSQHTLEQSTQYNFLPQGGAGIHYFIKDNVALNLEYRYRHLSNASIKHPNSGIDSNMYLGGVTFFFDNAKKSEDN